MLSKQYSLGGGHVAHCIYSCAQKKAVNLSQVPDYRAQWICWEGGKHPNYQTCPVAFRHSPYSFTPLCLLPALFQAN